MRHFASFSSWYNFTRHTRLELADVFARTEDPVSDLDRSRDLPEDPVSQDNTIRRNREPFIRNTARISLTHQFGKSDSFDLGYVYSLLENDDPTVEDNQSHMPQIGLTYWFTNRVGLESRASYTRANFDEIEDIENPTDDFDRWSGYTKLIRRLTKQLDLFLNYEHTYIDFKGDEEDYHLFAPSVGADYTIDENTSASAAVGYYIQDFEGGGNTENGFFFQGELSKTWAFKRGSVNLSGASGLDQSYFGAENLGFEVYYSIEGSADYRFTRYITGNIYGSYRLDDYKDNNREDQTKIAGAGLSYFPLRWLSMNLNYTYRTVDSTVNADEYDENRATFSVTLADPRRVSEPAASTGEVKP